MQLNNKHKKELIVNITPLIDVVFLLLIFFMVSTSFTRETQIELELPKATGDQLEVANNVVEVSIDAEGNFYVNKKPLINSQLTTLRRAILKQSEGDTSIPLIISADAKAPYQAVVTAMDAAGQEGFSNLKMATRRPADD
ncbi:MAG: biopolymer transporter ExbD [Gammaproteobacteria bacterium]|nr:MAG: biopolymer transporter ExbD [Gammaproteobacteria bacterium]